MNRRRKSRYRVIVRLSMDNEAFKREFSNATKKNTKLAYSMLNDEGLTFSGFYILVPQIKEYNLVNGLNKRNISALQVIAKVTNDEWLINNVGELVYDDNLKSTLQWMLNTGLEDDGLYDDFDRIIDTTVAILINYYDMKEMLPTIVDLIFSRNRSDLYIHDLMYIIFRTEDLDLLPMIASYLKSNDSKDKKLAYELLYLEREADEDDNSIDRYNEFTAWLNENLSYLYFTKETLQLTRYPKWYKIDLGAKYLCEAINPHTRLPIRPFSMNQFTKNEDFKVLPLDDKLLLANYSQVLHDRDLNGWNRWMMYSVHKQLLMLKNSGGGMS